MTHEYTGGSTRDTGQGGRAVALFNLSGLNISTGDLVQTSSSQDSSFTLASAGSTQPLGIAYEYVSPGELCWVVTDGLAYVRLQDNTGCNRGDALTVSDVQAGRVIANGTGRVVGRAMQAATESAGGASVLALIRIEDTTASTVITAEGGLAVLLTNGTGAPSVKGQVVQIFGSGADDTFIIAAAGFLAVVGGVAYAFGVVYESGVADGQPCWVVVSGPADVLLENGTRGHPLTMHESVAGHGAGVDYSAANPRYAQGLGVICGNFVAGGLTRCILQVDHSMSVIITGGV